MSLIIILILAVGLSMDAFSLSLIYGTINLDNKIHRLISCIVGIFHFFMPIIGYQIGELVLKVVKINPDTMVGILFIILSIEMLLAIKDDTKEKPLIGILSVIAFAFTVSIDSFSIGIGFGIANIKILLPCLIFAVTSSLFTYFGLKIGKKLSKKFGSITTLIGSIILFLLGISYLL